MADKLTNTLGSTDLDMETPESVLQHGAKAEAEVLLKYLLGLEIPTTLENQTERGAVAKHIVDRICVTRDTMFKNNLEGQLERRIQIALQEIASARTPTESEKATAIAESIYKVVPADLMTEFVAGRMTSLSGIDKGPESIISKTINFAATTKVAELLQPGVLPVPAIDASVQIDLSKPFWKGKKIGDFSTLEKILKDKNAKIKDFGIRISAAGINISENYHLNDEEIKALIGDATTPETWEVVRYGNNFGTLNRTETIGTTNVEWAADVDYLVMQKVAEPTIYQERSIGSLKRDELRDVLKFGTGGTFANWQKFVPELAKAGVVPDPTVVRPGGALSWADYVADQIFIQAGRSAATDRLAGQTMQLHEIQQEASEQFNAYRRLSTGSQNVMGASLAAAMIMRDHSLRAVTSSGDEAMSRKDMEKLEAKKSLYQLLDSLRGLAAPTIEKQLGGTQFNFELLKDEKKNLEKDAKLLGRSTFPAGTLFSSDFAQNDTVGMNRNIPTNYPASDPTPLTPYTNAEKKEGEKERKDDRTTIGNYLKDVNADLQRYEKIERALKDLHKKAVIAGYTGTYSSTLDDHLNLTTGDLDPGCPTSDFKPDNVADKIKDDLTKHPSSPLEALGQIDEDIKKKGEEIAKARKGTVSGDELQHKIFVAHLQKENPGMSDVEAEGAASYLANRTLTDQQMNRAIGETLNDMFPEEESKKWWEYEKIDEEKYESDLVAEVAASCGITELHTKKVLKKANPYNPASAIHEWREVPITNSVNWNRASYRSLCTAYFTLKRLLEGEEYGYLRSYGTKIINAEMKKIATILATRYIQALEHDFGTNLSEEERKKLRNKKMTSAEAIEKMLMGDPPERYLGRIEKVLKKTDKNLHWKRRRFVHTPLSAGKKAAKWLTMTATPWAAKGGWNLAGKTLNATVGKPLEVAWKNKGTLAAVGAMTVASGGMVGLAVGCGALYHFLSKNGKAA